LFREVVLVGSRVRARPFYIPAWYNARPDVKAVTPSNTFVRGEGMTVVLEDGTSVEDWTAQACANSLGLGRTDMSRVLAEQALRLPWLSPGLFADIRVALTEDLQTVLPHGISVPFYGVGGSDSIEAAIRAARKVTGRKNVLAFTDGYHGDTMTVESVSGGGVMDYGDPRPWAVHATSPYGWFQEFGDWDRAYERCLEGIERSLKKRGPRTFACALVEPVMGGGGVVPLSADLSKGLRELCDRYGIKLVADEVITGFGRTGEWFGSTTVGLEPDAMVLAKGFTGGYAPLGAAVFERSWGEELREKSFVHGLTFGGHPLSCAAARETIRILKAERLVERAKTIGAYLRKRLEEIGQEQPSIVRDVRGAGLLLALELRGGRQTIQVRNAERLVERAKTIGAYLRKRLEGTGREHTSFTQDVRGAGRLALELVDPQRRRQYKTHPAWPRVAAVWQGLQDEGVRLWTSSDGSSLLFCPPFIVAETQVDRLADRLNFHLHRVAQLDTVSSGIATPGEV
jgi:taurine--2-oxoglutarate transaminase